MNVLRAADNAFHGVQRRLRQMEVVNVRIFSTESKEDKLPPEPLEVGKPFKTIPSLKMWPFIGTSWTFMPIVGRYKVDKAHIAQHEKHKLLGDIFRDKFFRLNMVVLFNPEDVQKILFSGDRFPCRGTLESLKAYRESRKQWYPQQGLFLLQGMEWLVFRKKQFQLFDMSIMNRYFYALRNIAQDFVSKIQVDRDINNEIPDCLDGIYKWALESVFRVALDGRLHCLRTTQAETSDAARMIKSVHIMFECMNKLEPITGNVPFWKLFPTPTWRKFTKASDTFSSIAFKHINESLNSLPEDMEKMDIYRMTNLERMLTTPGVGVTGAMAMVTDMFMAGIDTVSHTVGFFLYNMAKNPDVQEKLFQSLQQLFPLKEFKMSTKNIEFLYQTNNYLQYCIKESMRLMPAVGGLVRILKKDVVLSGYHVPRGTHIAANLLEMMRDERYYAQPEKFIPERWVGHRQSFTYVPFGYGMRSCLGQLLARAEIIILTAEIIRNFKVEYHHEDIGLYTRLTNAPDKNLRLTFTDREYPEYSSDETWKMIIDRGEEENN